MVFSIFNKLLIIYNYLKISLNKNMACYNNENEILKIELKKVKENLEVMKKENENLKNTIKESTFKKKTLKSILKLYFLVTVTKGYFFFQIEKKMKKKKF